MATITRAARVLGIAMVVEEGDGTRTLYGISDVREARIEFVDDSDDMAHGDSWRTRSRGNYTRVELQASAGVGFIQRAGTGFQAPPQLPRGIYLPNMQFHALPEPGGEQ